MMLRTKYDGKCRKSNSIPNTIEELRSLISTQFGSAASKLAFSYKDCDDELVSVVDSEDLKNCISEAQAYKMSCITLLIKDENMSSRSMSSKKKSQSSSSETEEKSSSDDDHRAFVAADDVKVKADDQNEILKKKLIEEHQIALVKLEQETQSKISEIEKKKERRNHRDGHSKGKKEDTNGKLNLIQSIKEMKQFCENENLENPISIIKRILKSVKEEFPDLECNPQLLKLVLADCAETIKSTLKNSCAKIISEKPLIAKLGEANRPKYTSDISDKHRGRKEGADRDHQRRSEKLAEKEQRKREKDGSRLAKDAEKAHKKALKMEEKQGKDAQKALKKVVIGEQKAETDSQEQLIRSKVTALKELFPNANRPHLRSIVSQNPTLSPQELAPLIKATKIAQSSYHR